MKDSDWMSYMPTALKDLFLAFTLGFVLGTFIAFFPHRAAVSSDVALFNIVLAIFV